MKFTVLRYETIGSTNTEALRHARDGAEQGLCIVARQQTAGRGRYGRSWASPKDAGLYISIVLRPANAKATLALITLMAGVAGHDAVAELGLRPDIKWVNDILVGEKKLAGILAEATETKAGLAVVVGIGVNLRRANLPPDMAGTASSIESETQRAVAPSELETALLRFIDRYYGLLEGPNGAALILEEWRRRSSYFSGKAVKVTLGGNTMIGTTDGLEADGALRVRSTDGTVAIVHAGDVEKLRSIDWQPERL